MLKTSYNRARLILIALGGMAMGVAGYEQHYHADHQTPKKTRQRAGSRRSRKGGYGDTLMAHFATSEARAKSRAWHKIHG